ncbi:MAG: hypothetical protein K6G50_09215 [bacterium]|nr:hypothetical protein [bacterium]
MTLTDLGGIIGYVQDVSAISFFNGTNSTGTLTAAASNSCYVGGIIGYCYNNASSRVAYASEVRAIMQGGKVGMPSGVGATTPTYRGLYCGNPKVNSL